MLVNQKNLAQNTVAKPMGSEPIDTQLYRAIIKKVLCVHHKTLEINCLGTENAATSPLQKDMTVEIIHVSTPGEIALVECLAQEIWPQHFIPIIGAPQVEYMLEKFQTAEAILSQINSGWEYYLVRVDNEMVGYAGLVPDIDAKSLMLSKIYVKKSARGKGVGKSILDFVERKCRLEGLSNLWLTVNRFNSAPISWYEDHGFVTIDEVKKDIRGGFIMDDYVMEKKIKIENV